MKPELLYFTVELKKPRNRVAEAMYDRDGPYKAKRFKSELQYQRREKHRRRFPDAE